MILAEAFFSCLAPGWHKHVCMRRSLCFWEGWVLLTLSSLGKWQWFYPEDCLCRPVSPVRKGGLEDSEMIRSWASHCCSLCHSRISYHLLAKESSNFTPIHWLIYCSIRAFFGYHQVVLSGCCSVLGNVASTTKAFMGPWGQASYMPGQALQKLFPSASFPQPKKFLTGATPASELV